MSSRHGGQDGHLDATGEREVVYCHACSHEWYRDESGLTCPSCQGEVTEIVSPDNDPRDINDNLSTEPASPARPFSWGDDSDPDEADIEDHMTGDHGFVFNRSTRAGPRRQNHHNPDMDPVFTRFIDMVNSFGPSGGGPGRRRSQTNFPDNEHDHGHDEIPPHINPPYMLPPPHLRAFHEHHHTHFHTHQNESAGQPRVHRTTFRSGPFAGGHASFTVYSAPIQAHGGREGLAGGMRDPFQDIFTSVLRDINQPDPNRPNVTNPDGENPAAGFMAGLQEIMGLINPRHAMAGDAVYSQEALDRIISNLMETIPQSTGAPPATEEALNKLDRKAVTKEMLANEAKTDCSICIDELEEGDMLLSLPCKHWFHDKCAVPWLQAHNTCPICRTPIEQNERRGSGSQPNAANNNHSGNSGDTGNTRNAGGPTFVAAGLFRPRSADHHGEDASGTQPQRPSYRSYASASSARPPPNNSRLNEALRNVSSMQQRERERNRDQGSGSASAYDTSRLQRRNSMSPTSPRASAFGDSGSRIRQRSPSQSSSRWETSDRESARRPSGSGPLGWLRGRFSSSGGNNSSRGPEQP